MGPGVTVISLGELSRMTDFLYVSPLSPLVNPGLGLLYTLHPTRSVAPVQRQCPPLAVCPALGIPHAVGALCTRVRGADESPQASWKKWSWPASGRGGPDRLPSPLPFDPGSGSQPAATLGSLELNPGLRACPASPPQGRASTPSAIPAPTAGEAGAGERPESGARTLSHQGSFALFPPGG